MFASATEHQHQQAQTDQTSKPARENIPRAEMVINDVSEEQYSSSDRASGDNSKVHFYVIVYFRSDEVVIRPEH